MDTCAICRAKFTKLCLECRVLTDNGQEPESLCDITTGRCGHAYHRHCMNRWLKFREVCPLDNKEWRTNEIESLQTLCVRELVIAPDSLMQLACNPISNDPEISNNMLRFTKPFHEGLNIDIKVASALGTAFQNFALDGQYSAQAKILKNARE